MCMSMKMIVCINVNQHVFGSITGEMSKGDRYYPFISVLIEFSLVFFFFWEYFLGMFCSSFLLENLFSTSFYCFEFVCFIALWRGWRENLKGAGQKQVVLRILFFNSMDQVWVVSKPDPWISRSGKNSTLLSLAMMN